MKKLLLVAVLFFSRNALSTDLKLSKLPVMKCTDFKEAFKCSLKYGLTQEPNTVFVVDYSSRYSGEETLFCSFKVDEELIIVKCFPIYLPSWRLDKAVSQLFNNKELERKTTFKKFFTTKPPLPLLLDSFIRLNLSSGGPFTELLNLSSQFDKQAAKEVDIILDKIWNKDPSRLKVEKEHGFYLDFARLSSKNRNCLFGEKPEEKTKEERERKTDAALETKKCKTVVCLDRKTTGFKAVACLNREKVTAEESFLRKESEKEKNIRILVEELNILGSNPLPPLHTLARLVRPNEKHSEKKTEEESEEKFVESEGEVVFEPEESVSQGSSSEDEVEEESEVEDLDSQGEN